MSYDEYDEMDYDGYGYQDYDGQPDLEEWADYHGDEYGDEYYSAYADIDWDSHFDDKPGSYDGTSRHNNYERTHTSHRPDYDSGMGVAYCKAEIHRVELLLTEATAAAAALSRKLAKAGDPQLVKEYQQSLDDKHAEMHRYTDELEKLKTKYLPMEERQERQHTLFMAILAAVVIALAVIIVCACI